MSTYSDTKIKESMDSNKLIQDGDLSQIGPACYELRMGNVYYDLTEGDMQLKVTKSSGVLIKPGHRVVLITKESLLIPDDVIARVTSKGSLFSIGLSPVSTYADPGFAGNLGIVTQNMSDKYIIIPMGESIAKIDFSTLSEKSETPYKGQHGYQTKIWPIKHQLQKTYDEISQDPRVGSELEEAYKILPAATTKIIKELRKKQKLIHWSIFAALVINTVAIASLSSKLLEPINSIILDIISTVILGVFMYIIDRKE